VRKQFSETTTKPLVNPQGLLAATIAFALLVLLCIAFVDRPVATWMHENLGDERFGWFTINYAGVPLKFGPFALMATPAEVLWPLAPLTAAVMAIAALGVGRPPKGYGRIALALCFSVLVAIPINGSLKFTFGRTWPESWIGRNPSWIRNGVYGFFPFHEGEGWRAFPSGHTMVISAFASVLYVASPKLRPACVALVALVVLGLIGGNYHFVSDTIAGLYFGAGIGLGTAALMLSPTAGIGSEQVCGSS
jgi:membrane-associated phospholipid phosphatase